VSVLLASAAAKAETPGHASDNSQSDKHMPHAADETPRHEDGIQAGGFILRPGASFSLGFDSLGAKDDVNSKGDGFVDIGIHLKTKLRDEDTHSWNNKLSIHWEQFFGLDNEPPSGEPTVVLTSEADLFKESFLRISPKLSYSYLPGPALDEFQMFHDNHDMRLGSAFILQPDQGASVSQRLGYFFHGKIYQGLMGLTFFDHRFDAATRWTFFPELSMALNLDFRVIHYLKAERPASNDSISTQQANHTALPFRVKYSLGGTALEHFNYELGAGYSYAYYGKEAKSHLFIMHAKFECAFTEDTKIFVEYRKDHNNALYGDFYRFHRGTFGFDALWFERLHTTASFGVGYFTFQASHTAIRKDLLLYAQASIDYSFMPNMHLGVDYTAHHNTSDMAIAEYTKHVVTLHFGYEY